MLVIQIANTTNEPLWRTDRMNINQVREKLHLLIDEVDDIYVLNGLYRNLLSDKQQRELYEKEQLEKARKQGRTGQR